jgi:amylosucrase
MESYEWRREAARSSLNRLLPRLENFHAKALTGIPGEWNHFKNRLNREWERLFVCLHELYGWQYDFFYTLEQILDMLIQQWLDRPEAMQKLDEQREADPFWYLSEDIVGIVLYVDLFSDNLPGLRNQIPYFEKLGVNYLHSDAFIFGSPRGK